MYNFNYYTPTKVVFGKDSEQQVGKLVKEQKGTKVLIHYGGGSAKRSGLLDRVCESLETEGISYVMLGGVVPNPRISKAREGIELCKREGVDFILAVGGGSVIDSAKAIGYGAANDADVWDFYEHTRTATACLPIGAVLTIAAAGSEMSDSSVMTNEENWIKRGYSSDLSRCRFTVMNPELTLTLPMYQTQSGCVDILMHTMERYFNDGASMEITDGISESLMRCVIKQSQILMKQPNDYDARAEVMWAGSLSHNDLTGCGTNGGDWGPHQLEHELGGMFDVAHGAGLSAIWGSWARYVYKENIARFAQFAVKVLELPLQEDLEQLALRGIEAMEAFYRSIEMPTTIRELGIELTEEQVEELALKCSFYGKRTIGAVKKLSQKEIADIYMTARG